MPTTDPLDSRKFAVPYTEIVDEPYRESWRTNGSEATRILECPWNLRKEFMWDTLGWSNNNAGVLERVLPEQHPDFPNNTPGFGFYAAQAELLGGVGVPSIVPSGLDGGMIRFLDTLPGTDDPTPGEEVYGRARFAVTYRARPYVIKADGDTSNELQRFVERRQTFAAENLEILGQAFYYVDDPATRVQIGVPKLFFTKELTYIWYEVPTVPEDAIENCIGTLNDDTFDGRYPAGTLLMLAPDVVRQDNAIGYINYTIAYKFLYRADTWNVAIRPATGVLVPIAYVSDDSLAPYEVTDFNTLFTIPAP